MKKAFILPILSLLLITACEKEKITTATGNADLPIEVVETKQNTKSVPTAPAGATAADRSSNQVTICHKTGNGQYNPIQVNENAVAAHLAHGDYLPDADGDGYSAVGACTGSQDDCDDTNAAIHPGAEEVCDDNLDNDCDGNVDEGCLLTVTLPDGSLMYVHPTDNGKAEWGGYYYDIPALDNKTTYAAAMADFNGEGNTQIILSYLSGSGYAAKLCADLDAYGYQDWYLPAAGELNAMLQQVGNMQGGDYWSSSEYNATDAWHNGSTDRKYSRYQCRCVRK